jgi:uncharacterized membrane protein
MRVVLYLEYAAWSSDGRGGEAVVVSIAKVLPFTLIREREH